MNETQIKRALSRAVLSAPGRLLRALAGERRADGNLLDPQIQTLLRMSELLREPMTHEEPVPVARATFRRQMAIVDVARQAGVTAEDRSIEGPGGAIGLRIYRPEGLPRGAPALSYFHGGGFVIGDLKSHDRVCRRMAHQAQAVVIAADYRLAPEHPFPAAIDDGLAAYRWASERRDELGIGALGVAGDSAGGCLAAVVCQQAAALGLPQPALQFLIYPVTDVNSTLPSRQTFARGVFLEQATIDWFMEHYLPDHALRTDVRASPLLAERLEGLAPALVVTAGFAALADEGHCAASLPHGFWSMGGVIDEAHTWVDRLSWRAGQMLRQA